MNHIKVLNCKQKALDDELVTLANHLKIGKCNLRLSFNLNSKEPTLQVVLDALKLTSIYKAFEITADVPEIYMQELWVTVSRHHSSLHFKMNGKIHTVYVDNFKDMLQVCPKLPGQKFKDPLFEEEILSFIRELGYTGADKGTVVSPGVPDVPTYDSDNEQISWKSSDDEDDDDADSQGNDDQDDDNEQTESGNDGDDLLYPNNLAQKDNSHDSFNELTDTPLDFSAFVMNWLKVNTLTLELLVGLTFKLMKGSCKSLVELEYFFEEVYKATTDQLDWNNPKG
nr:hypothetical protein [Tanacetum cinerariifolium]